MKQKQFIYIVTAILGIGVFFWLFFSDNQKQQIQSLEAPINSVNNQKIIGKPSQPEDQISGKDDIYTLTDVSKHTTKGDCWMVMDGTVYDLSSYTKHPGGDSLLVGCGKDATELFETRPMGSGTAHSDKARSYREQYKIGLIRQ